ncbi:putative psoralen synthase [Dioscorea sansibarensis]
MFRAGTESTVLEWSLAKLIKNPKVMKTLQNEIKSVMHWKSMVKEKDICAMKNLKAFIKEILRLHPPDPLILLKESIVSCQIEGSKVIINYWVIARDSKVWDTPDFNPEGFLSNDIDFKGQNYKFIPFGASRKICPGI